MPTARVLLRLARLACLTAIALLLAPAQALAQSATAGTPVARTHLAAETNPSVIADGAGGAYVGFKIAYRSPANPAEIAVARIAPSGGPDFGWSALPMTPAGSLVQSSPPGPSRVLVALAGNVLAFADYSTTTPQFIVRELGASGADPGYPGFKSTYQYNTFNVVSRSDGGALILSKVPGSINLLSTIVTAAGAGSEVFTPITNIGNGITSSVGGDVIAAVPSGVNGALAVMLEPFATNMATGIDMIAVRVDAAGNPLWPSAARVITAAVGDQRNQVVVSDGGDGVVIAWDDGRNAATAPDIFAQRLLANGTVAAGWTAGGKTICNVTTGQFLPSIASDDAGGAWIAWTDARSMMLNGLDLYFTHVLANGTLAAGFAVNGRVLCNAAGDQSDVRLVRDGSGGAFAIWLDSRDGEQDLFAQHLNSAGNPTASWAATGNAVCTDGTPQTAPAVALTTNGLAIVAWNDTRTGTDVVYVAALDAAKGVLDAPRPAAVRLALAPGANPARGGLELRIDAVEAGEVRVTLFDVAGRVQAERMLTAPARAASLRFDGLRPGVYLARATQGGASTSTRIAVLE